MRLKDTKTVKAMIDRINSQPSPTPENPFPQRPTKQTEAWLGEGDTITIDFAKLKDILAAKEVDLTEVMIVGEDNCGQIAFGKNEFDEDSLFLTPYVEEGSAYIYLYAGGDESTPTSATVGATIAEALTSAGTIELTLEGWQGHAYIDFETFTIEATTTQTATMTGEEAASFITITPATPDSE